MQAAHPKEIKLSSIIKIIERNIERAGLNTTHKVMKTNGFRKFAITQMIKSKVDYEVREYLVGHKHSRGLDMNYDRTDEYTRISEWAKAIPNLTISSSFRNKVKLKKLEGEHEQKLSKLAAQNSELQAALKKRDEQYKELWKAIRELQDGKSSYVLKECGEIDESESES